MKTLALLLCLLALAGNRPDWESGWEAFSGGFPKVKARLEERDALRQEEYAAIRASVPYPGLRSIRGVFGVDLLAFLPDGDPKPQPLADLLAFAWIPGYEDDTFGRPEDIPERTAAANALWAAFGAADSQRYPQLRPIAEAVGDRDMVLREHLEQTVRRLYGPTVKVTHQDCGKWTWRQREGVYTPPHVGGVDRTLPFLLEARETGGGYEVTVVYAALSVGGYLDENNVFIPVGPPVYNPETGGFRGLERDPAFRALLLERLPRYTACVKALPEGGLYLYSLQKVPD